MRRNPRSAAPVGPSPSLLDRHLRTLLARSSGILIVAVLLALPLAVQATDSVEPGLSATPQGSEAVLAFGSVKQGAGDIYTIRADGTERRHIGEGFDPIWSPDGSMIAFYTNSASGPWELMVADAEGVRKLADGVPCLALDQGQGAPTWSPDSRFVIYLTMRAGATDCGTASYDLSVIAADGSSAAHLLLASPVSTLSSAWSPTGEQIVFQAHDGLTSSLSVADVPDPARPWGLTAQQVSDAGAYGPDSWGLPRWSPDATMIATTRVPAGATAWDAIVVPADGSMDPMDVTPGPEDTGPPEWSPDGSSLGILHLAGPGTTGDDLYDLYLSKPDGSDAQRVEAPPLSGWAGGLPFSPDGTRAIGRSPGNVTLLVITLDGSVAPVTLYTPEPDSSAVSWQPVDNAASPLAWAPLDAPYASRPTIGDAADDGARIVAVDTIDARTRDLTIDSPSVGIVQVRLLLPASFDAEPDTTWPVLYLLHGAWGNHADWTNLTDVEALTAPTDLLVVMPDAANGWYTDAWNEGAGGPPAWETFHTTELLQLLERNWQAGDDRVVAGLSMGGLGAMDYAARHPGMFKAAASYSGVLDTIGSELDNGEATFGDPVAQADNWKAHNPLDLAPALEGIPLYVSYGDGQPGPLDPAGTEPV